MTVRRIRVPRIPDEVVERYIKIVSARIKDELKPVEFDKYANAARKAAEEVLKWLEGEPDPVGALVSAFRPTKTGKMGRIPAFSLPAFVTCPAYTGFCALFCYAAKGRYITPAVTRARFRNLLLTLVDQAAPAVGRVMAREAPRRHAYARLHDSGNIYRMSSMMRWLIGLGIDVDRISRILGVDVRALGEFHYVDWLARMVRAALDAGLSSVYTYTRAWRDDELWAAIEERLVPIDGMVIYLSVDLGMPVGEVEKARRIASGYRNVNVAYTGFRPEDIGLSRDKYVVCPAETTGVKCTECLVCPRSICDVVFPIH